MRVDRRLLGWGLFLILVGAIPLLVRGGVLDRDLVDEWPNLWPLLLIGWGLSLVLRRTPGELLGSAISVVVLGAMVGGLISTGFGGFRSFASMGCNDGEGGTAFGSRSGSLGDSAGVGIEFNCGELNVTAVDGADWSFTGSGPEGRSPIVEAGGREVDFRPAEDEDFAFWEVGSVWDIEVPRDSVLDFGVTLNAGSGTFDLEGAMLDGLSLTLNAGAIDFNMADAAALDSISATVNAGSAAFDLPEGVDSLSMTINAGSIEVCAPTSARVRVSWSGALGGNNFDAAGLRKIDDQHWESPDIAGGSVIEMSVSANAGSFNLDFGGSCDA